MLRPGTLRAPKLGFIAVQAPPPLNRRPQNIPPQLLRRATLQPEAPREPTGIEALRIYVPAPNIVATPRPVPDLPLSPAPQPRLLPEVVTGRFDSALPNTLAAGGSALPNAMLPARLVQTGSFGDPHGLPADAHNRSGQVTIAALGSFDLPSGPGNGNGSGGATGARGVVTNAGFGNGIARANDRRRTETTVKDSGFAETVSVRKVTASEPVPHLSDMVPVHIEFKPKPSYTDDARRLHLEGEVLLEVTFGADGRVAVRRVLRGLGHGLDESAVRAAEQIRFKPATRAGFPVDSEAVLHIVFQLA